MCEQSVQDRITLLGPPTFLPQMRRLKRSHKRGASPFQPILPRYLFVQLDLPNDRDLVAIVKQYPGVKAWLGATVSREMPLALRPKDFERLQALATEMSQEPPTPSDTITPLPRDTLVRILWAPLHGQSAKVVVDNGIRADLLLMAAGVASKVSLPRDLIEQVL